MAIRNFKINYLGFLGFLGLLGFVNPAYFLFFLFFLFFFASVKNNGSPTLIQKQSQEKAEHKQKILGLLESNDKIVNNDVEKLLGVSDATAERYLNELEAEGKIKQMGETGRGVFYAKF